MDNIFFDLKRLKYLGVGAIIGRAVRIRRPEDCIIGDHAIIDDFTYISCALEVGRYVHIAPNVTMGGGGGTIRMGDFSGISSGCTLHCASSDYLAASFDFPTIPAGHRRGGVCEDIELADFTLLGSNTVVLPGVRFPEGAATGAMTLLRKKRYQPWTLYCRDRNPIPRSSTGAREKAAELLALCEPPVPDGKKPKAGNEPVN